MHSEDYTKVKTAPSLGFECKCTAQTLLQVWLDNLLVWAGLALFIFKNGVI